jgi:hypothetical protein
MSSVKSFKIERNNNFDLHFLLHIYYLHGVTKRSYDGATFTFSDSKAPIFPWQPSYHCLSCGFVACPFRWLRRCRQQARTWTSNPVFPVYACMYKSQHHRKLHFSWCHWSTGAGEFRRIVGAWDFIDGGLQPDRDMFQRWLAISVERHLRPCS